MEEVQNINERVIKYYEQDEEMMVLIFAQWCVNNDLDAIELYKQAYPEQGGNKLLEQLLAETVEKAEEVTDDIVLNALQLFGNDDLAFIVQQIINKRASSK